MRAALLLSSLLVACSSGLQKTAPIDWTAARTPDQKHAFLNALADSCRLPYNFFRLKGDAFYIVPQPNEAYEHVACALEALKRIRGNPKYYILGNGYLRDGTK